MTYFFDGENQFKIYILYKLDKIEDKRTVQDIKVDLIHEDCKPISILSYKPRYKTVYYTYAMFVHCNYV